MALGHRAFRSIGLAIAASAVFVAAAALQARADVYTWDFSSTYQISQTGNTSFGNTRTFDAVGASTETVIVRAYATSGNDLTGAFVTAYVGLYDGGLGISNPSESPTPPATSPNHAIDNNGRDDFLLMEFDDPNHLFTGFQIGWMNSDSDVQVWVGGPTASGFSLASSSVTCGGACDPEDLAALGFVPLAVFENVALNTMQNVMTTISGRYVLIAGQSGEYDDYFKVDAARASDVSQVPEPSSLSLALAGLAVLLAFARRRRRYHAGA